MGRWKITNPICDVTTVVVHPICDVTKITNYRRYQWAGRSEKEGYNVIRGIITWDIM